MIALFLFVVVFFFGFAIALNVQIIINLRSYINEFHLTNRKKKRNWRFNLIISIVFIIIALASLCGYILFSEYWLWLTIFSVALFVLTLSRSTVINITLQEIHSLKLILRDRNEVLTTKIDNLQRFITPDFPKLIAKKDIASLQAGDNIQIRSNIVYIDLYNKISSEFHRDTAQHFQQLVKYSQNIGALLSEYQYQYIQSTGRGVMALFEVDTIGVFDAILKIKAALSTISATGDKNDSDALSIAIFQGILSVGVTSDGRTLRIVGSSDALNIAMQLQQVAQQLSIPILLGQSSATLISQHPKYQLRYTGIVENKYNAQLTKTFELVNGYADRQREKILETLQDFEDARIAQERGEIHKAYSKFTYILSINPADRVAQYFQKQCSDILVEEQDSQDE